jgi:hypothetical protein
MLLDLCKGFKIVIFPLAVFHSVHSYYTILWIFEEEQYGPGGGVDEAAGVRVRHLGQEEPGPLPGRGRNPHSPPPSSTYGWLSLLNTWPTYQSPWWTATTKLL